MQRPESFRINYASPLARGLVFAGLGQSPGSVRYKDSSSRRNDGTLTAMTPSTDWVWVPELGRWGLDFAGDDDYVATPQIYSATTSGTVCAWVYPDSLSSLDRIYTGGDYLSRLYLYRNNATLTAYFGGAGAFTGGSLVISSWQHVAVTWSGTAATLYRNGVAVGTGTGAAAGNAYSAIAAYRDVGSAAEFWDGQITDVMLYRGRALSLPEIQTLANPADPMLGGLVQPPKRKLYAVRSTVPYRRFKLGKLLVRG